jgi:hypothetical protein
MGGKGKGKDSGKEKNSQVSYDRDFLLQLKLASMKLHASPPSKESLHCLSREVVGNLEVAQASRPRAASDSAHPAVKNKPTTVALNNIPVKYSRTRLCEELAAHGFGYAIDFLYMPIDPASGHNLGYAFINVRSKDAHRDFVRAFHDVPASSCFPGFPTSKNCEVSKAEIQGRDANMRHLCSASNLHKWKAHDEWQPIFLDDYGKTIPLAQWQSGVENGKQKKASSAQNSPMLAPQAHPPGILDCSEQTIKSWMSMRKEAAVFSPSMRPEAKPFLPSTCGETKLASSSVPTGTPQSSPTLRAEANEFVPSAELLPEPALVD